MVVALQGIIRTPAGCHGDRSGDDADTSATSLKQVYGPGTHQHATAPNATAATSCAGTCELELLAAVEAGAGKFAAILTSKRFARA